LFAVLCARLHETLRYPQPPCASLGKEKWEVGFSVLCAPLCAWHRTGKCCSRGGQATQSQGPRWVRCGQRLAKGCVRVYVRENGVCPCACTHIKTLKNGSWRASRSWPARGSLRPLVVRTGSNPDKGTRPLGRFL
jgi:hypothetical protein